MRKPSSASGDRNKFRNAKFLATHCDEGHSDCDGVLDLKRVLFKLNRFDWQDFLFQREKYRRAWLKLRSRILTKLKQKRCQSMFEKERNSNMSKFYGHLNWVFCTLPALRSVCGIDTAAQHTPCQGHKIHGVQTVQFKQDTL